MPQDLASRVQFALAREAAERAAGPVGARAAGDRAAPDDREAPVPALSGATQPLLLAAHGRPRHGHRQHGRRRHGQRRVTPRMPGTLVLRGLAAVGAVAVIVGIGFLVTGGFGSSPTTSATRSSSPANQSNQAASRPVTGRLTRPVTLGYSHDGATATTTALASGTNYTPATLNSLVSSEVASHARQFRSGTFAPAGATAPSGATNRVADPGESIGGITAGQLGACVSRVAGGQDVILVDVARYGGKPAVIIVAGTAGPDLQVYVVGQECSAARADLVTSATVPAG